MDVCDQCEYEHTEGEQTADHAAEDVSAFSFLVGNGDVFVLSQQTAEHLFLDYFIIREFTPFIYLEIKLGFSFSRKVRDRNTLATASKDLVTSSRVWEDFWKDGL